MTASDSDFERLCEAYWTGRERGLAWDRLDDKTKGHTRRGMLAALREMREPTDAELESPADLLPDDAPWVADMRISLQAWLDEILKGVPEEIHDRSR